MESLKKQYVYDVYHMMGVTKWYLIRTQADNMSKIGIALQFLHFDLLSYLHMLSLVRSPRLSADEVPLIVSAGTGLTVARYLFSKYLTEHPLQSGCKETLVVTARKEGFQCARNLRKIVCLFLSPNRPILSPSSNNQEVHGVCA